MHRIFGYHTFVRDHWRDGYPWYALALALAIVAATQLDDIVAWRARRAVIVLTVVATAWIVVMNFAPIPALLPLYLIRASLLTKPLVMGLALTALTRRRYEGKYAFLAPWAGALAVAHPDRMVAEAALAIVLGIVLRPSADRRLAAAGATAWTCGLLALLVVMVRQVPLLYGLTELTTPVRWATFALGVITTGLLLLRPRSVAEGTSTARRGWAAFPIAIALPVLAVVLARPFGIGWLPDSSVAISRRLHLSRPLPKEAGAMGWALNNSPSGSLFAVPPLDPNWVRFRLVTHRGIYIFVHDLNQLMYVRDYVLPAVDRLATLGVIINAPHNFDATAYLRPTCSRLQRLAREGVSYYVLPAKAVVPAGGVLTYHDSNYSILDVRRTALDCRA